MTVIAGALWLGAPGTAAAQDPAPAQTASVASVGLLAEGVGMRDEASIRVRRVQRVLARRGYDLGAPGVDGRFGPLTAAAVRRYQSRNGLVADGIVGPRTRRVLARLQARQQRAAREREPASPQSSSPPSTTTPRTPTTTTPQSQSTTPQAPATTPQPAASPPQRTTAPAASGGDDTALVVASVAVALSVLTLLAMIGGWRRRRPREGGDDDLMVAPIGGEVMLEGRSSDPAIGEFRGRALASAVPSDERSETRFLIDDPRKPAPVWVSGADVARSAGDLPSDTPVIGYVTLPGGPSDHEARAFGEIEAFCTSRGWQLLEIVRDQEGTRMLERPGLEYALREIAAGNAHGLVVSDMQRLARSIVDVGALLEWFRDAHATLVALDLDLDTTSDLGDRVAGTLVRLGSWERQRIATRTRTGLARVRAEGQAAGRPSVADDPELLGRIAGMRQNGMTLQAISDQLNDEGVPTMRGGAKWRPSSVQAALGYKRPSSRNPKDQLPSPRPGQQGHSG